ncbi:MAG: hypothetical protein JRN15_16110 [Nitrososphaerota archaeon]|nr:hypothetical protein [Nitrososphaerota archaeon]
MSSKGKTSKKRIQKRTASPSQSAAGTKELATKLISRVPTENGFYFYNSFGNPTGVVACSFGEFCDHLRSSSPESVQFHISRGDFENWIRFLGDEELANKIGKLRSGNLPKEEQAHAIVSAIQERHNQLQNLAQS